MKTLFTGVLLAVCVYGKSQPANDSIKWNSFAASRLTMADFKHKPDKSSQFAAMTDVARPAEWFTRHDTLFIKMQAVFIKSKSWFNKEKGSATNLPILLAHEQGHFDLGEIEVRKTKKQFHDNAASMNKRNFKLIVERYFNEQGRNIEKSNNLYDKETKFSTNEQKQNEWTAKIATDIRELEPYKNDLIVIPLQK